MEDGSIRRISALSRGGPSREIRSAQDQGRLRGADLARYQNDFGVQYHEGKSTETVSRHLLTVTITTSNGATIITAGTILILAKAFALNAEKGADLVEWEFGIRQSATSSIGQSVDHIRVDKSAGSGRGGRRNTPVYGGHGRDACCCSNLDLGFLDTHFNSLSRSGWLMCPLKSASNRMNCHAQPTLQGAENCHLIVPI